MRDAKGLGLVHLDTMLLPVQELWLSILEERYTYLPPAAHRNTARPDAPDWAEIRRQVCAETLSFDEALAPYLASEKELWRFLEGALGVFENVWEYRLHLRVGASEFLDWLSFERVQVVIIAPYAPLFLEAIGERFFAKWEAWPVSYLQAGSRMLSLKALDRLLHTQDLRGLAVWGDTVHCRRIASHWKLPWKCALPQGRLEW